MATVYVRKGRVKPILHRHPWLYGNSVDRVEGDPEPGDVVDVRAPDGMFLGRGLHHPESALAVRLFAWEEGADLDQEAIAERVRTAVAYRHEVLELGSATTGYRVLHGDADLLPGVVCDRYEDHLVLQVSTLGMERRLDDLVTALVQSLGPRGIHRNADARIRKKEGLDRPTETTVFGDPPDGPVEFRERDLRFAIDPIGGQKTGFYLDQRDNRALAERFAPGRRVLDLFSYTGAFGVSCARGGASEVEAVDTSPSAVERIADHAERNEVGDRVEAVKGDAFEVLDEAADDPRDMVIVDPPKYAKHRKAVKKALRTYHALNRRAIRATRPGGLLVTCSCSRPVDAEDLMETVKEAALREERTVRLIERRGQAPDHATLLRAPEGRYLTVLFCQVL